VDEPRRPQIYREIIDDLVHRCREGQGQIGARRARAGVWNANARPDFVPEQHQFNLLLAGMTEPDREILATMLSREFVAGVHTALVALHEAGIEPFEDGYEGAPFNDFVGRLDDWPWPDEPSQTD
jgi:hypothetical protein